MSSDTCECCGFHVDACSCVHKEKAEGPVRVAQLAGELQAEIDWLVKSANEHAERTNRELLAAVKALLEVTEPGRPINGRALEVAEHARALAKLALENSRWQP